MKNKWYTINDIVLALLIITVAALIIMWRFNILIQYPDQLAKNSGKRETEIARHEDKKDASQNASINMGEAFKNGQLIDNVNITILEGNDEAAFKDLFDKKLFDNYAQFEDALKSLNLSVDMVRRGTMGFIKGTSVETLLKDLTS